MTEVVAESQNVSDYVRVLQQIDAEFVSTWWVKHGFAAGVARHQFISKRFDNIGTHIEKMYSDMSADDKTILLVQFNEAITEQQEMYP